MNVCLSLEMSEIKTSFEACIKSGAVILCFLLSTNTILWFSHNVFPQPKLRNSGNLISYLVAFIVTWLTNPPEEQHHKSIHIFLS